MIKLEKLNKVLNEYDTKIRYYVLKAQMFYNDGNKMEEEMKENKENIEKNNTESTALKEKKDSLNKKNKLIEEEISQNKKRKEELNDESSKMEKELESYKSLLKEKKSNENFLSNYDYEQKELLNDIQRLEKNRHR